MGSNSIVTFKICFVLTICLIGNIVAQSEFKVLKRVYDNCENSDEFFKCLKIQALKVTDRALNTNKVSLLDGISFVRDESVNGAKRSMPSTSEQLSDAKLNSLKSNEIDQLILNRAQQFFETHKIELSVPQLLSETEDNNIETGRGKKDKKGGGHEHIMALAMMAKSILTMISMKFVAVLAMKALMVGKIALVLSAILGLKKLLSSEGHEKTTYEIIKHPHVSHSQSYSTSHYGANGGEYDATGIGHYHRSLDSTEGAEYVGQDKAYKAYAQAKKYV